MTNQISKEKLVEYLNQRKDSYTHPQRPQTSTTIAKAQLLDAIINNIKIGMFDEKEYNVAPNGAMFDKSIPFDTFTKK